MKLSPVTIRVYCWEKKQPANFDKIDYQTLPIITYFAFFLFIYFMAAQEDCIQIL